MHVDVPYGTTVQGGAGSRSTVFRVRPDGSLCGTTSEGGHGAGDTVYRLLFPAGDLNHDGLADCSDITLVNRRFDLAFDPTILAATLGLPGSLLPGCCFNAGTIDNTAGTIVDIADTRSGPDPGVTRSGDLAIISFQALTAGTRLITFASVIWMDSSLGDIVLARLMGGTGPSAVRRSRNPAPGSSSPPAARRCWAMAGGAAAARKSALPVGVTGRSPRQDSEVPGHPFEPCGWRSSPRSAAILAACGAGETPALPGKTRQALLSRD